MTKTEKKSIYTPLIVAGYVTFSLLVFTSIISTTIPFGSLLFHPNSIKINVTIAMLALTIGAILPVLVGYIIGGHAVKSKSKASHHFNGMLFGLLAFWLMTLLGAFLWAPFEFLSSNVRMVALNLLPSSIIAIVTTTLAVAHIKSHEAKRDVLEYKPFAIALIACTIAMPLLTLIQSLALDDRGIHMLLPIATVMFPGLISYISLRKARLRTFIRVAWSAVSVSVLYMMMFVAYMLIPSFLQYFLPYSTMEQQTAGGIVAAALAIIAWAAYWLLQVKTLQDGKK